MPKIVEVHPNWNLVDHTDACVSVREMKPRKHVYHMGTVHLADAHFKINQGGVRKARQEGRRNVHAWVVGELLHEAPERLTPPQHVLRQLVRVTYHFDTGRFLTVESNPAKVVDVTDGRFAAAVQVGRNLYISKDW
jgi:hypothetical protein